MTDARSKQPDKLDVDLKRLGIGDPYVAIIESWTYFGIKNEDVFPRELTVRFQAGGFAEAVAKARTLAETLKIAHDIHQTNVRLVCEEARFDAMTKADRARKPADFVEQSKAKRTDLGFPFQHRVRDWVLACFGEVIAADVTERNHRFLEEALELVQAKGCTASEARQLVEYVFARPAGDPNQEVGGVLVTLAALCEPSGIDMVQAVGSHAGLDAAADALRELDQASEAFADRVEWDGEPEHHFANVGKMVELGSDSKREGDAA